MKKLLAMILMASITLPALAKEVKLQCKINDEKNSATEIWSFDEAAGTVTFPWEGGKKISTQTKCKKIDGPLKTCYEVYITPEEFGMTRSWTTEDKPHNKMSISRMDGTMRWGTPELAGIHERGTCVPFKQAF